MPVASVRGGLLAAGDYADAATQDAFCQHTVCTITKLYDQSANHNDLTVSGAGQAGSYNVGARADDLPVTAGGHRAYGILVHPGTGYRRSVGAGVATNGAPKSMYMVASGTYATDLCCYDFGNVETEPVNHGTGTMNALIISTSCEARWGAYPCNGTGPWVQADLENGVFQGNGSTPNPSNVSLRKPFITAMLRTNGQTSYALDGADAHAGTLTALYNGPLPTTHAPLRQEGGIVLGTGGDNSNAAPGAFLEGAMTSGYASNSTIAAVQANIAAVGYTGTTGGGPGVAITGPGGKCVDVNGDDIGVNEAAVQLWSCLHDAVDQHWTLKPDNSLQTLGRCMDIDGNTTANNTNVKLYDCNGVGGQTWVQQADGTLRNPQSGRCLTAQGGATANGTRLQISDCTGGAAQQFRITHGRPIAAPGGNCVDVYGDNIGGNGAQINLWDCLREATDQYWLHNSDGSITSIGRCLDITGNSTANGASVQLYDCNGVGGQKWVQQADGTLRNPQSGRCLTAQGGATANGTPLQISDCTGGAAQRFLATGGQPIKAPGGKCVDVNGDDEYGNWQGIPVQMWDCLTTAADQHWVRNANNTLETLDRCLDIVGNATAGGSKVQLFNCNGVGGQQWIQQANGTLRNPQSGRCLTTPGGATANGTQLEISDCTGAANQIFTVG